MSRNAKVRMPLAVLWGALALLTAVGCSGDTKKDSGKNGKDAKDGEVLVLEEYEIDLVPEGPEKTLKVKSGKAEDAKAPEGSGVTAKTDGNTVTLSAGKDAKPGKHEVTVKGGKKDVTVKVNVKKKE